MVEQSAVNRLVAGSSPAWGVPILKVLFELNNLNPRILFIIESLYLDYSIIFDLKNLLNTKVINKIKKIFFLFYF